MYYINILVLRVFYSICTIHMDETFFSLHFYEIIHNYVTAFLQSTDNNTDDIKNS